MKAITRVGFVELLLVGSAASLLEGDDLSLECFITGPVPVVIRSLAAQVAHPCLHSGETKQSISIRARDHASIYWGVEPTIVAGGARHENTMHLDVDATSQVLVRDLSVLGRSGEDSTTVGLRSSTTASVDGRLVFEDGFGSRLPGAHGPAGLAGHRVIGTVARFGQPALVLPDLPAEERRNTNLRSARTPLASAGTIVRSLSRDMTSSQPILALADTWWNVMQHAVSDRC